MTEFELLYHSCHPKERSLKRWGNCKSIQCNNFEQYSRHCLLFAWGNQLLKWFVRHWERTLCLIERAKSKDSKLEILIWTIVRVHEKLGESEESLDENKSDSDEKNRQSIMKQLENNLVPDLQAIKPWLWRKRERRRKNLFAHIYAQTKKSSLRNLAIRTEPCLVSNFRTLSHALAIFWK